MRVATATLRVLVEVGCVVGGEAGCIVGPFELGFCGTSTGSVRRVGAAYVTFCPFAGWSRGSSVIFAPCAVRTSTSNRCRPHFRSHLPNIVPVMPRRGPEVGSRRAALDRVRAE